MTPSIKDTDTVDLRYTEDRINHTAATMMQANSIGRKPVVQYQGARLDALIGTRFIAGNSQHIEGQPDYWAPSDHPSSITAARLVSTKQVSFDQGAPLMVLVNAPSFATEIDSQHVGEWLNYKPHINQFSALTDSIPAWVKQTSHEQHTPPWIVTDSQQPYVSELVKLIDKDYRAWREVIQDIGTSVSMLADSLGALFRRALETQIYSVLTSSHATLADNDPPLSTMRSPNLIPAELDQRLHLISQLPQDWNSYGAVPIAPDSIAETRRIIELGLGLGLPVPRVSPMSRASMSIEWDTTCGELVIDILPTKEKSFALALDEDDEDLEGVLDDTNIDDILHRLVSPDP